MAMNRIGVLLIAFCLPLFGDALPGTSETAALTRNVEIDGAVKQPGAYALKPSEQLLALIGRSGGVTRLSNRKVYIVRGRGERLSVYQTDIDKLRMGTKDYTLFDGDRLFLPSND